MKDEDLEKKEENSSEDKDNKEKNSQEEEIKRLEKEIQDMIEDMKTVMGDDAVPDVKIMAAPPISKKRRFTFMLIEILISILSLVALTGYIKWIKCDKIYFYFINIGMIVLIESILSFLINRFGIKLIIYSFGTIIYVPAIIGFFVVGLLTLGITSLEIGKTILVCVLYLIIKKIIMWLIKGTSKPIQVKEIKK